VYEKIGAIARLERAVREEQGKVADFVETAPAGFYSVDERGRFLYANQTFASWLGTTPAQLVAEASLGDFLGEAAVAEQLRPAQISRGAQEVNTRIRGASCMSISARRSSAATMAACARARWCRT
jgi:PAS domain-containing protein